MQWGAFDSSQQPLVFMSHPPLEVAGCGFSNSEFWLTGQQCFAYLHFHGVNKTLVFCAKYLSELH